MLPRTESPSSSGGAYSKLNIRVWYGRQANDVSVFCGNYRNSTHKNVISLSQVERTCGTRPNARETTEQRSMSDVNGTLGNSGHAHSDETSLLSVPHSDERMDAALHAPTKVIRWFDRSMSWAPGYTTGVTLASFEGSGLTMLICT